MLVASLMGAPFASAENLQATSNVENVNKGVVDGASSDAVVSGAFADDAHLDLPVDSSSAEDADVKGDKQGAVPASGADIESEQKIEGVDAKAVSNTPDTNNPNNEVSGQAAENSISVQADHSVTVPMEEKSGTNKVYEVSADDVSCMAGQTVTVKLVVSATGDTVKKYEYKDNNGTIEEQGASFGVVSDYVTGAGVLRFSGQTLKDDLKKGSTTTLEFTVRVPETAASGTYPVTVTAAFIYDKKKPAISRTFELDLHITSTMQGAAVVFGSDAGCQLSGYKKTYSSESLAFSFDALNYGAQSASYDWDFALKSAENANGELQDITDKVQPQWNPALPGAQGNGRAGEGAMAASEQAKAKVAIDASVIDPNQKNSVYRATLTLTDKATGRVTSQSVTIHRERNDLSNHTFKLINVGSKGSYSSTLSTYETKYGTDWFDDLYYNNVANDSRVPFSDAQSFREYLSSLPEELVDAEFNKYIYDMYNSNTSLSKKTDYADDLAKWYKDGSTPFHAVAKNGVNKLTYSLEDGGVTYDEDYFQNLSKTAQVNGREGNVSISADTKPTPRAPRVYLIRTQGSWQMFDMAHALSDDGAGIMYSDIDQLATYYDLKQALLRFSEFLKEKSGGSVALGFLTFSHAGEYTMFTGSGYLCNDPETIEAGIHGWDTFGDCEHSHYSDQLLKDALSNVPNELANWEDSTGLKISSQVKKTAIFIGGPCEPTTGTNGYAISLPQQYLAENMDHTYGIQTVKGTSTVVDRQGNTIQSWLDYEGKDDKKDKNGYTTNNRDLWAKAGNGFYVAPSEDEIYNALVDIYNKDADEVTEYGTVDATVTDTVQKEFEVTGATATWTSAKTGTEVNVPADSIRFVENADGSTTVTCDYGECKGTGTIKLDIAVKAKDDYIGGNNVFTNVDVPHLNFSGKNPETDETEQFDKDFPQKPEVNVKLLDIAATGGQGTHQVNNEFNLADHAEFDSGTLLSGYPQTNGTLRLEWVETNANGNELQDQTLTFTPGSYRITNGELTGAGEIKLPDCTVNSNVVKTRYFKLKATYTPDERDGTTKNLPAAGIAKAEADVTLHWIDQMMVGLRIHKVAAGAEQTPLPDVGFTLYTDEGCTQVADVSIDAALANKLGADGVRTDSSGYAAFYGLEIGKTYYLKETRAAAGFSLSSQVWTIVADSDSKVTVNGQEAPGTIVPTGSSKYYQAEATIENDKVPSLPVTGVLGGGLAALGGLLAAMGLCLCAWQLHKRRQGV